MKVAKRSNLTVLGTGDSVARQLPTVDADLKQLFDAMTGRIRFGRGDDGDRGENMSGEFQEFISSGAANTEFSVTHTVGSVPVGILILWQDLAGSLYQGPATGTAWTDTTIYLKCSVASVTFKVFLVK
jgi:hypothetical protein